MPVANTETNASRTDPLLADALKNLNLVQQQHVQIQENDGVACTDQETNTSNRPLISVSELNQLCSSTTSLGYVFSNDVVALKNNRYRKTSTLVFGIITALRTRTVSNFSNKHQELRFDITDPTMPVNCRSDAFSLPQAVRYVLLYMEYSDYAQSLMPLLTSNNGDETNAYNCLGSLLAMSNPEIKVDVKSNRCELMLPCECAFFALLPGVTLAQVPSEFWTENSIETVAEKFREICHGNVKRFLTRQSVQPVYLKYCWCLLQWWHEILPENSPSLDKTAAQNEENRLNELVTRLACAANPMNAEIFDKQRLIETYRQAAGSVSASNENEILNKVFSRFCETFQCNTLYARSRVQLESVGIMRMDEFLRLTSSGDDENDQQQKNEFAELNPASYNSAEKGAYVWCMYVRMLSNPPDYEHAVEKMLKVACESSDSAAACMQHKPSAMLQTMYDANADIDLCRNYSATTNEESRLLPIFILPDEINYQLFFGSLLDDADESETENDEITQAEIRNVMRFHNILSLFHYVIREKKSFMVQFTVQSFCDVRQQLINGYWGRFFRHLLQKQKNATMDSADDAKNLEINAENTPFYSAQSKLESEMTQSFAEISRPSAEDEQFAKPNFVEKRFIVDNAKLYHLPILKCYGSDVQSAVIGLDVLVDADEVAQYRRDVYWTAPSSNGAQVDASSQPPPRPPTAGSDSQL